MDTGLDQRQRNHVGLIHWLNIAALDPELEAYRASQQPLDHKWKMYLLAYEDKMEVILCPSQEAIQRQANFLCLEFHKADK